MVAYCKLPMSPPNTAVFSVVYYPNVTFASVKACMTAAPPPACALESLLTSRYLSSQHDAVFLDVFLGEDPASPRGMDWLVEVRKLIADAAAREHVNGALVGGMTYMYDAVQVWCMHVHVHVMYILWRVGCIEA